MVRFSLKSAAPPDASPFFSMNAWEQQHLVLGSALPAYNKGLSGMCVGEKRRLVYSAADFELSEAQAARSPLVECEVELLSLTPPGDYAIFEMIEKGDVSGIMEMVDHHVGVNAVDKYGNSALMAAVDAGAPMQMVVATLINAWQPRVDVNFQKPSGHSALFYAATADEKRGTAILRALLKLGANPNVALTQPGTLGFTPLHFACKTLNLKNAALLLEFGADPLAMTGEEGLSVLDVAKDAAYSVRKKLAALLNDALARIESEEAANSALGAPPGGTPAGPPGGGGGDEL